MNTVLLALRQLRREWRSGELAVLIAALLVAVAALSSVSFFTDRVRILVEQRAGESLAADLVIQSRSEIPDAFALDALDAGLDTARILTFPSVVLHDDASQLAEIRAVTEKYPLRGRLRISDEPYGPVRDVNSLPADGEAWVEPRLVAALGITVGDEVKVGRKTFTITQVLDYAPDQGFSFAEIAPMLLIPYTALEDSGLLGPASRVSHRLLMAGNSDAVAAMKESLEPQLETNQRLLDIRDSRPEMARAVERADRFLNLAALVAVLLAGIAIAMAARRYAERETDTVAIMKCLGSSRRGVLGAYVTQLLLLALAAGIGGLVIGFWAQEILVYLLRDFVGQDLPDAALDSAPLSFTLGLIILAGFGMPPVLALARTAPIRVLRRDLGAAPVSSRIIYGVAIASIAALLIIQTGDLELSGYVLGGTAGGAILLAAGAAALIFGLGKMRSGVGIAWRFGVASIVRRGRNSIIQVVAFGLGLLILLLLAVVRTDLLSSWQAMLPDNAPNHFMINIQPDEADDVREYFRRNNIEPPLLQGMVRARLSHINDTPITDIDFSAEGQSQRFAEREANLSWGAELSDSNTLLEGEWFDASDHGEPLVSLEEDAAERLGVGLGDELTYDIAGESITVTVDSIRHIDWDSFQPNFFMQFPPGVLEDYPGTFITSIYLPSERAPVLLGLVREYPSITVIDLDAIIAQVRDVMDQAALAVEYVFLFTLAAGVLVLLAAVQASRDERRFESAILRTLGASKRTVFSGVAAEFLLLGLLSSLLAVIGAGIAGWGLATQVFELDYSPSINLWLIGLVLGTLWVGATGMLATRNVVKQPPLMTLRK
jgi:putative ABC transport system permease protein